MNVQPWPELLEGDRWLAELMDHRLQETKQAPEELRARAHELRAEAETCEIKGMREAALALAERYEQAAVARLST